MITNSFPNSKKITKKSKLHHLPVPFREISINNPDAESFEFYDTSGCYSEENFSPDYCQGIPKIRTEWIKKRDTLLFDERSIPYEEPYKLKKDNLIFHNKPAPFKGNSNVTQLHYAKKELSLKKWIISQPEKMFLLNLF